MSRKRTPAEWYALIQSGIAVGQIGWKFYKNTQARLAQLKAADEYFLVLTQEDDDIWWAARRWVLRQVVDEARQTVEVVTLDGALVEVPNSETVSYPITFNEHKIRVVIRKPDLGGTPEETMTPVVRDLYDRMVFTLPNPVVRAELVTFLETLMPKEPTERMSRVFRSRGSVGGWRFVRNLKHRNPDSLVLSGDLLNEIITDMSKFLDDEQEYVDRGLPWHRGYLLYGPPGTGKSSLIATLADQLDRDVHFMSLKNIDGDDTLIECVSDMGAKSILVLEDVDCVKAAHVRSASGDEAGAKGVSIQGLLNVLDGLLTPHGMITFMTTNHVEELDDALIRPGRADKRYELGYLTQDQLDRLIARFVGPEWAGKVALTRDDATSGEVVECFKASFDYPAEHIVECIRQVVTR